MDDGTDDWITGRFMRAVTYRKSEMEREKSLAKYHKNFVQISNIEIWF